MSPSRPKRTANRKGKRSSSRDNPGGGHVFIYGLHAVAAVLGNPRRRISRLLLTENAAQTLAESIEGRGSVVPEIVASSEISRTVGGDAVHQGALLFAHPLDDVDLSALAPGDGDGRTTIVILDQVTDPHNVGAILRSAAVFGVGGLIMTRRHSAPLGEVTAKVASGGLEHVRIVLVNNLAQAIRDVQRLGYHVIGLDGDGQQPLTQAKSDGPTALVLGAEGAGLRHLTREICDEICHLPTNGPLRSLNVSNAAAVALAIASSNLS